MAEAEEGTVMADLNTRTASLRGIGTRRAAALAKLGIETLGGLLAWFPRRYEDRRTLRRIAELSDGETACVQALITVPPSVSHIREGLDLVKVHAADSTGTLEITFFNQLWRRSELLPGEIYIFYGRTEVSGLRHMMANPVTEHRDRQEFTGCIVPVYPLAAGVSQLILRRCVREGLRACADTLPDILPETIRSEHQLCDVSYAYENIHFPSDETALQTARRRLAFEELFLFALGVRSMRGQREGISVKPYQNTDLSGFYNALPFTLTNAQKRCIEEAAEDMASGRRMNRLCQGDVGAGKTMVAAGCIYLCVKNGQQAALMAPTEILANQHFQTLSNLMESFNIHCALLTGSTGAKERRKIMERLRTGEINLIIGTHALIYADLPYDSLGLVITDEQHRFGVAQRTALSAAGKHPHTLVMSATPIPRTLALVLYGDLDISILDELPPGRRKIKTYAVSGNYRPRIYKFIEDHAAQGEQIYIVCSMVEENDSIPDERKAVTKYAAELRKNIFPDLRILTVHGRMKAKEKDKIMNAFAAGDADILVSTTVIEVGVDVPNASVIIIENAERFGLSQLHQLRGRVGRGNRQSYCILISDHANEETRERLRVMVNSSDGFRIAEEDLKLRGPGDFFGQRQHGLPGLKVADLGIDTELLQEAQSAAELLLHDDPDLSAYPILAGQVREMFSGNADAGL